MMAGIGRLMERLKSAFGKGRPKMIFSNGFPSRERPQPMVPPRLLGEIDAYCYMVERGKPAALLPVTREYAESIERYVVKTYGLQVRTIELSETWVEVWIYRDPHIQQVIEALPRVATSTVDHWILGKLFGYDERAIDTFLSSH